MKKKILSLMISFLLSFIISIPALADVILPTTEKQYHEQIDKIWKKQKARYQLLISKSSDNPRILYNIQGETNNLLKYAGYCKKYALLDELSGLYLRSLNTLKTTDQYVYEYFPQNKRLSVHTLDKKYRMWVNDAKPVGQEVILDSSQYLYLLSDVVSIIVDIEKDKRTPMMREALNKFIPLLMEHYQRWIFIKPGPFQVRGWGCRYNGEYVPSGMNHFDFLNKKLGYQLGNGKSPVYCNSVTDVDMWIIAGVTNVLAVYKKEKNLVPITPEEYRRLLNYVQLGSKLIESRFSDTRLKDLKGKYVTGTLFQRGTGETFPDYEFAGYTGQEFPKTTPINKLRYRQKGVAWDLSHSRRFVHVFETLSENKDILGLNFPTKDHMVKMANQLNYATFNLDFKKPLFSNFMDGTNGWYRINYADRKGFGYGPSDMSIAVLIGGYGFWSIYSSDTQKIFTALSDMLKSKDPEVRKHVINHYETYVWKQHNRAREFDFEKPDDSKTLSILIQFLPSLCFVYH